MVWFHHKFFENISTHDEVVKEEELPLLLGALADFGVIAVGQLGRNSAYVVILAICTNAHR